MNTRKLSISAGKLLLAVTHRTAPIALGFPTFHDDQNLAPHKRCIFQAGRPMKTYLDMTKSVSLKHKRYQSTYDIKN